MNKNNTFLLIHSPLVGPLTWSLVAEQMRQKDINVIVPTLIDSPASNEPFWKQHAESVSHALADIPNDIILTLIAHSGAGPLLPAIRETFPNPIRAYVFVDAGIPHGGATRLELMRSEDPDWARQFQEYLEQGGQFPNWSFEDLQEVIPAKYLRAQTVAEIRPRALNFFTERIPVFESWPDAPCAYILFSEPYRRALLQARQEGWQTYELDAGHFHMLVDAQTVTNLIIEAVNKRT